MHKADYQLFPQLRLICIIYSGDVDGHEIADHISGLIQDGEVDISWNCVVDLRSFIGNVHHSSLERMSKLLNVKRRPGIFTHGLEKDRRKVAIVSYNAGQKFLINLARVYIRDYDLQHFSDMRQGFAWACGQDALPRHMMSLDWHLELATQDESPDRGR
ncbi:hypothetical protein [Nitrospirillum pindoramense]|uniref:SpoIIAA-like protein n=1 Tax=Nitrospirillum amazonense TaxID=28077 RepID=A0A560HKY7_9PROT|nr:hypothetical protein [Nitrospirillum amazonense]TWB46159.1 hypothetical protein FBZ90_101494 [Nitrospirillum amazonense]